MPLTPYATVADLREWIDLADDAPDPASAAQRLRSATIRVAYACNLSPYDTPSGDVLQPLNDATCAQAAAWIAQGINPDSAGLDGTLIKRSAVLTGTVEYETSGRAAMFAAAANELAPEARDILFSAGLLFLPGEFEIADGGCGVAEATELPYWDGYSLGAVPIGPDCPDVAGQVDAEIGRLLG